MVRDSYFKRTINVVSFALLLFLPLLTWGVSGREDDTADRILLSTGYIFNLGFPKAGSSSLYHYLQCRHGPDPSTSRLVSHYLCGRKEVLSSREFQTCGECVQRAAASPSFLSVNHSCSGSRAFSQLDFANYSACVFPQIENIDYLLRVHPNAKYLLLTRPANHWLRSVRGFFDLKMRLLACLQRKPHLFPKFAAMSAAEKMGYAAREEGGELLQDWRAWHQASVQRLFSRRGEGRHSLLVLDVEEDLISVQTRLDAFLRWATPLSGGACWRHMNNNTRAAR